MDISIGSVQLTITLYLIGLAAGRLLYGPISDRFGPRPVLLASMSLFTRLLLSPVVLAFAVGGALTTTSFYGFMAAAPFIFENHLHQRTQDVGLYYLLLMAAWRRAAS